MNRMVVERFCAEYGLDKDSVNPEILGLLRGASKDHLKAYNRLQKFNVLQQAAKDSGKSFGDVLSWLREGLT